LAFDTLVATSLLLLTAGAAVSPDLPQQQATRAPVNAHLMAPGVRVADLDRSIKFYDLALGFVVGTTLHHGTLTEVMLCSDAPDRRLALILLQETASRQSARPKSDNGLAKIVVEVPDVAAVALRLTAAGYPVGTIHAPAPGRAVVNLSDPDGYQLELIGRSAPAAAR
jgi:catechol 2,3-dioxygenase-like lactoylglutathione lyase family enzyme